MIKSESFVSVVSILRSPLAEIRGRLTEVQQQLDSLYSDYEVVVVVPGPVGGAASDEDSVLRDLPCIRIIQLASSVHDDVALGAGLESAIGDFVVLLDLQADPSAVIPPLVEKCRAGFDVVVGVAEQQRSLAYRFFRVFADSALRAIGYELPRSATGLRCLSRRAVNAVTRTGRFHHQFYLRIQKTGYPACAFPYQQLAFSGERGFVDGFRDLIRLMVFNSSRPLRWMSFLGFGGSMAAFTFAVYSVLLHLVRGHVVEGWTTTVLFMSVLFMLQFVMMAFFGEYLGRLLDDRSEQSDYAVVYERNSSVMVNADRVNVLGDSEAQSINRVQTGRDR